MFGPTMRSVAPFITAACVPTPSAYWLLMVTVASVMVRSLVNPVLLPELNTIAPGPLMLIGPLSKAMTGAIVWPR